MSRPMLVDNPKGLPIIDATEDVVIQVTAKHVRSAIPMNPKKCAIANGCRGSIEGLVDASINLSVSYLTFKDKILRFKTPQRAVRELVSFDRDAPFTPGEYYLKRPSKTARLDARPGRPKGKRNGSRPARQPARLTAMVRGA